MFKSLLSKRSQDDTFPFTPDILTISEIARISSMKNIIFVIHWPYKFVHITKKTLWQFISLVKSTRTTMEQ